MARLDDTRTDSGDAWRGDWNHSAHNTHILTALQLPQTLPGTGQFCGSTVLSQVYSPFRLIEEEL